MLYDDFKTECRIFKREIMSRRLAEAPPMNCLVLMKDDTEKRVQCTGQVLDYDEQEQMFIIEVNEKRYFFNRLCI